MMFPQANDRIKSEEDGRLIAELEYDNPLYAKSLNGEKIHYSKCAHLISDIHAHMPLINEPRMSAREELCTLEVSSNFCINQSTLTIFLE